MGVKVRLRERTTGKVKVTATTSVHFQDNISNAPKKLSL